MEMQKVTEIKSALPRTEYVFNAKYEQSTPSRAELKSKIASKLKSKEELTVVKKINNHYGDKEVRVEVYVYNDEKALNEIEFKHVLKKHNPPVEGEQ
jgi:ribosomal protein S24E